MRRPARVLARAIAVLVILVAAFLQLRRGHSAAPKLSPHDPNAALLAAAREHASGMEVEAYGRVARLLPVDTEGSRHQRFLVRIGDRLTILVAHNLDLAPEIPLGPGDSVALRGEYVWNERGGMIHWTHHDPAGRHESGWIDYGGRRFK
jgi:hypothetical protein